MRNPARVDSAQAQAYKIPTDGAEADGTAEWNSTTIVVRLDCDSRGGTVSPARDRPGHGLVFDADTADRYLELP